jgi:hypothetical protein
MSPWDARAAKCEWRRLSTLGAYYQLLQGNTGVCKEAFAVPRPSPGTPLAAN